MPERIARHCYFADQNSGFLQWSIKISELDFVVEHRAETKTAHVDALSRHVGTIVQRYPR